MLGYGLFSEVTQAHFCNVLRYYVERPRRRELMHDESESLLDGQGVQRVAEAILELV